jgi:hypothetical protein
VQPAIQPAPASDAAVVQPAMLRKTSLAHEAKQAQPAPRKVRASEIPLWGPGEYGVWTTSLDVEGVSHLRDYLLQRWGQAKFLPLKSGGVLGSYNGYHLTSAEYNKSEQERNVLRWKSNMIYSIRASLPGYAEIESAVGVFLQQVFPHLFPGLEIHNGHILRQFNQADGGSGFSDHIDEADDEEEETMLYISVAIKLSNDPPGADGSWMRVKGYAPVRYGSAAGSVIAFLSRRTHCSLRTPPNMEKVLKLVLFYKFNDPLLKQTYAMIAPPPLNHWLPLELPALPYQERDIRTACKEWATHFTPILKTVWDTPEGQLLALKVGKLRTWNAEELYVQPLFGVCGKVCILLTTHDCMPFHVDIAIMAAHWGGNAHRGRISSASVHHLWHGSQYLDKG